MDRPSSDETSPLLGQFASNSVPTSPFPVILPDKGKYAKYKRRWYIWLLFVLVSNISSLLEYTWSPIQETCQLVYGWTNQNTLVIGVLESLTSFVTILPWAWVLDNKGKIHITKLLRFLKLVFTSSRRSYGAPEGTRKLKSFEWLDCTNNKVLNVAIAQTIKF